MSVEFDQVRARAADIANVERERFVAEVRMQNRGPVVDIYLRAAGVGDSTFNSSSERGAQDRMWCGMFVYYCYLRAAGGLQLPFQPEGRDPAGSHLWSGARLVRWARTHPQAVVSPNSLIQPGDIFSIANNHIGMAVGPSYAGGNFKTIEGNQGDLDHQPEITRHHGIQQNGIQRKSMNVRNCRIIVRI